jgi:lysophospholipase L1-like esterase
LKNIFIILSPLIFSIKVCSQKIDNWHLKPLDSNSISHVDFSQNELKNTHSLQPFLNKLFDLKTAPKDNVVVVHIGDSHIQSDMITAVIRNEFQNYFGNAGRGLVFPFQIVKSNAPSDLIFSSKNNWRGNRITKTDTVTACGISGFGMKSHDNDPSFGFGFRVINEPKQSFDRLRFFMGENVSELLFEYNDYEVENLCFESPTAYALIDFKSLTSGFKVTFPTLDAIAFYGVSLEKKDAKGILYHTIGANGARFSDYTKTKLFWRQLKQLQADCYVISLGTNEAQDQNLTAQDFTQQIKMMVDKIRIVSPSATIIISTPAVSYFKKIKPNPELSVITTAIIDYCTQNNLVYWDLYNISKGGDGARNWKNKRLLGQDLVHFSKEGYVLQGNLFVQAFAKSWNTFLNKK